MSRRRPAARAPAPAVVLAVVGGLAFAGSPAAEVRPRYAAEVEVRLRSTRVLVEGPDGPAPDDLEAADFSVLEGGEEVEVAAVERVAPPRRTEAATGTAPEAAPLPPGEVGSRRFLFLFDLLNPGPARQTQQAKSDLKAFARDRLGPADEVSVVYLGTRGLVASPFSGDPEQIAAEVDGLRLRPEDLPGASAVAAQARSLRTDEGGAAPTPPPLASLYALHGGRRFLSTDAVERRTVLSRYLRVVADLGRTLRLVPGRKIVVLFTGGFRGSELLGDRVVARKFTAAVRELQDSGTVVYTVDTNGLANPILDEVFGAQHGYLGYDDPVRAEASLGVDHLRDVSNDFFDRQAGGFVLAHETGGRFFQGVDRFAPALEALERRESAWWQVSWYSRPAGRPGEFRRVEVRVRRPGLRVAGGGGYLERREFARMSELEREVDLLQAVESGAERRELPATARADLFPDGKGGQVAVLTLALPGRELELGRLARGTEAVDVVVAAPDEHGGFARWTRGALTAQALAAAAKSPVWVYEHGLAASAPPRRVALALRENARGRTFSATLDLAPPRDGLTRPVRIRQVEGVTVSRAGDLPRDPFDFGGIRLVPAADDEVDPGERLFVLLESAGPGAEGALAYALASGGGERALLPGPAPEQLRETRVVGGRGEIVSVLARVPTAGLAAGAHELVVRGAGGRETRYAFRVR